MGAVIKFEHKGNFNKTELFLRRIRYREQYKKLDKLAQKGVNALAHATPIDTGKTASSWGYEIHTSGSTVSIVWTNSNMNNGVNIALLLQYGHGTRNGGYVKGRDYINPVMQPIFDEILEEVWKEVTK